MAQLSSERSSNESGTKESASDSGFTPFSVPQLAIPPSLVAKTGPKPDNVDLSSSFPARGDRTHLASIPFVGLSSRTTGLPMT